MDQKALDVWNVLDESELGKLEVSTLPGLLSNLGVPLTMPLGELEMELDRDGNGLVYREDFVAWAATTVENDAGDFVGGGLEEGSTASSNMLGLTPEELWKKMEKITAQAKSITSSDIHEAAWRGDLELLKRYIYIDPSLSDSPDDSEWGGDYTPLHYAAYQGHTEICEALIDDPMVDINRRTSSGCTPLFLASQQGRADVVRILLKAGANPTISEDEYSFTPIDVARQHKATIFSIFKDGEEWEYEKWKQAPPQLERPSVQNARLKSFECVLPTLTDEDDDALKVREYKVKVVELPEGRIVDLLVVPRENWSGGEEEPIIVRNLVSGASYAVYVAGVNGMGYGEYSEMSEVISTKIAKTKKKAKEVAVEQASHAKSLEPVPPIDAKREKKKKKKRTPVKVEEEDRRSKTLQPVENQRVEAKMSKTKKKKSSEKTVTSLSLPTPTKMTPQQMQVNSDESSEMDFDALSNDASETASEGEAENNQNLATLEG